MPASAPQNFQSVNPGPDPGGATLPLYDVIDAPDQKLVVSLRLLYNTTPPVTSVSRGLQDFTRAGFVQDTHTNNNVGTVDIWYLDDPDPGLEDIDALFGATIFEAGMCAWYWNGVQAGAPASVPSSHSDLSSPVSLSVTPAAANAVIGDAMWISDGSSNQNLVPTQTLIGQMNVRLADNLWDHGMSHAIAPSAAAVAMGWSWLGGGQSAQAHIAATWPEAGAPAAPPIGYTGFMMGM